MFKSSRTRSGSDAAAIERPSIGFVAVLIPPVTSALQDRLQESHIGRFVINDEDIRIGKRGRHEQTETNNNGDKLAKCYLNELNALMLTAVLFFQSQRSVDGAQQSINFKRLREIIAHAEAAQTLDLPGGSVGAEYHHRNSRWCSARCVGRRTTSSPLRSGKWRSSRMRSG